jgi:signal transduction histidine kinase
LRRRDPAKVALLWVGVMNEIASTQGAAAGEGGKRRNRPLLDLGLMLGALLLPALLVYSSIRGYREVVEFRDLYLRSRAMTIRDQIALAGKEQLPRIEPVLEAGRDVIGVRVYAAPPGPEDPQAEAVASILSGKLGYAESESGGVYRALIGLADGDWAAQPGVVEVELRAEAGDVLIREALEHLLIAFLAALGSVGTLAAYLFLSRRTARLERLAEIGTMSAALAHEIRNPLGTIKGFAQLSRQAATEQVGGFQDLILREVGRLEKLVNDLLSSARPRAPRIQSVTWAEIQTRLPPSGVDSGVSLEYAGGGQTLFETDPDLMVEILHNLIRNALEASDAGRVRVRAGVSEGWGVIRVDDEGAGLPPSARARLFEPFFSTKPTGTGLGLPICKSLLDRLGGKLSLTPRSPRGVRAEVRVPLGAEAGEN